MTPEREAEIATRDLLATKGPWGLYEEATGHQHIAAGLEETGHGYRCRRGIAQLDPEPIDNDPAHREWTEAEDREQVRIDAEFIAHSREDVPALLAELAAVRAERDMARLDAELQRSAYFTEAARLLEAAGRDDDAVNLLDNLAAGIRTGVEDPNDNRRRLYIDGKGNGWISACADEGTEWVVPVQPEAAVEQDVRDVADETGSLREIGRCW